jgi:DMSO reductase family type II enzyme heme b subunit
MTTDGDDPGVLEGIEHSQSLALAAMLAVLVVGAAALVPVLVDARPAYEIPVRSQPTAGDLAEPTGDDWDTVPAASVDLSSAGAAVPNADDTTVESISVAVARADGRLYVRLSWADATADRSNDDLREFADAVAVQLPVNESARPPIAMGSTSNRVNVWYWSATGQNQSLHAGGPGTTTPLPDAGLSANATHDDGRWNVVFSRPLAVERSNVTEVTATEDVDVALAVWNGSNMERSGQKAASEWYYLALAPDTDGPPYQAILWTIAALAIVFTTLITVEGVRRTRGD